MRSLAPALLALSLTACLETEGPGDFADVLPDERVKINLPVDMAGSARDTDWSQFYLMTAEVTENVNGLIGGVLFMVDTITDYEPTWSDTEVNTAVWGPWADPLDPVQTLMWVHHDDATDVYTWGFNQKPKNDDEADWSVVIAGQVEAGATADVSSGWFAVDFDTMHDLDPTTDLIGAFICEYDLGEDGVSASAIFDELAEAGASETTDGMYHYEQEHGGDGLMDLARTIDLDPGEGAGLDEVLVIRSRWTQEGEGRADAYATGGDLGSQTGTATECWDTSFEAVYYTDNYSGTEEGDEAACAFEEPDYNESEV